MDQSDLLHVINLLVQLPESDDNKETYLENLNSNVENVIKTCHLSDEFKKKIENVTKVTPRFVLTSLYILKQLSKFCNEDSSSNLISIQNQQKIKVLLQIIFSLGLTPSMRKGVNTILKNKAHQLNLLNLEKLHLAQAYNLMIDVVRFAVEMLSAPNLRALIITHLGDLLAALLQVVYIGKLKKPSTNFCPVDNQSRENENFVMTEEFYEKMVKDRAEFKMIHSKLVSDVYKPLIVKNLMFLLAPTKSAENGEIIPPPIWLKKAISNQLTEYLINPGGVTFVMQAMCEPDADAVDWKKVDVLGKLISTVQGNLSEDEFYGKISPQIISILDMTGPYCTPLAKNCIKNIYLRNAEICDRYIFQKLFHVFVECSKPVPENFTGTLICEETLCKTIDRLTKCFSPGSSESSVPESVLLKIIKILFKLHMKVAESAYQHKASIRDLLIGFLHSENDVGKLSSVYNALVFDEPHGAILEMNENLEFQFGPSGGIRVGKRQYDEIPSIFRGGQFELELEKTGDSMLDLLSSSRDRCKKLLSDLFVILLSSLSDKMDGEEIAAVPDSNPDLLTVDELIMDLMKKSQKRIITIKLLSVLAENKFVMETIQEKPEIVFKFVKNLLESKAESVLRLERGNDSNGVQDGGEENGVDDDADDVIVALAIVDLMTVKENSNSERWDECKSLLNSIKIIRSHVRDANAKYYSDILYNRIHTRGAVSGTVKPLIRPFGKNGNSAADSRKKCFEREEMAPNHFQPEVGNKNEKLKVGETGSGKNELEIVLDEIRSEDVPTRGHAIIQLGKLIEKKDVKTLSMKDSIFSILKCNLKHEDTYVYLSAINSLEALAKVQKADRILEILCEEYAENKKEFAEIQIKLGEVLMRITRGLGEMAPEHKSLLINVFLSGTKSSDEFLRISSLSNLGELLNVLRFNVGSIVQEVFVCVKSIATTDKSVMARRAAVMVIQFLLKGINPDSFMVLKNVIRDLYRSLLLIYKTDKDEVTRLHAELAIAEIDRIVKSSVSEPLKKLEKRITVLGLP